MQKTESVSVLAANFNNGPFLKEFIESILASTNLPEQIIIIDDASSDESIEILREYESHPLLRIVYLEKNIGFGNALNEGLKRVSTEFILRADPDDRFLPERIKKQTEFLKAHPEISGVGCNVRYFSHQSGKLLLRSNFPVTAEAVKNAYLRGEHGMQHPTVAIRTAVFKAYAYRQDRVPAEDYDIFSRMIKDGHPFTNLPEVLYEMRIHDASVTSNIRFQTIEKTYELRNEIFGKKTSRFKQKRYYYYIYFYRRGLIANQLAPRYFYFLLASFCWPAKLVRKIIK